MKKFSESKSTFFLIELKSGEELEPYMYGRYLSRECVEDYIKDGKFHIGDYSVHEAATVSPLDVSFVRSLIVDVVNDNSNISDFEAEHWIPHESDERIKKVTEIINGFFHETRCRFEDGEELDITEFEVKK